MTLNGTILAVVGAGWLVLVIWLLFVTMSIRKINRRAGIVIRKGGKDVNSVGKVENNLNEVALLHDNLNTAIKADYGSLVQIFETAISRIGLVRFNAFEDVGGMQSFAVALLNDRGDGVVISAINGRNEGRTYAKPVKRGRSEFTLSSEESRAISKALAKATKIS